MEKNCKNEHIDIALYHLDEATKELNELTSSVMELLQELLQKVQDPKMHEKILETIAKLQLEDIIVQRIRRVEDFLKMVDKNVMLEADKNFLEEFAWENEVDQNDIDKMLQEYKG